MSEEPKKPFEKIAGIAENASALQKLTHALGRAVEIIMEYPPGSSPHHESYYF